MGFNANATFNNISITKNVHMYILVVRLFIGGGNRSTRRKPPTSRKSLTTLSHNVSSTPRHERGSNS